MAAEATAAEEDTVWEEDTVGEAAMAAVVTGRPVVMAGAHMAPFAAVTQIADTVAVTQLSMPG
jgi:hypothetical protein